MSTLEQKIAAAIANDDDSGSDYDRVLDKLKEFATALQNALKSDKIHVNIEPGHRVNKGQQYVFVISTDQPKSRDTLFRAYIPMGGFPVTLDLFDDEHPQCSTLDDLEGKVVDFFGHRDVKQRLRSLQELTK